MTQMETVLDLAIILTPPSTEAPEEAMANIVVRCDALGLSSTAGLLTAPLTDQERNDLQWYLEEYWKWPYAGFAERGKHLEGHLVVIGQRLYHMVFGSVLELVQRWQSHPATQYQISIVSTLPAVLSLPWELLHDEQNFLILRAQQPVVLMRHLEYQKWSKEWSIPFTPPLRVLLMIARPSELGFLDPRHLARDLLDAVQPQIDAGMIEVEFLRPPTREALRYRLAQTDQPVHLLHFDGHGSFNVEDSQGVLAFEDNEGNIDLVGADNLGLLLQESGIKLVVLDACKSAQGASDNAFSSIATRLIYEGIDATIAMSASVLVTTSKLFFAHLYRELAAGTPIPVAVARARQALATDPRRHVFQRRTEEEGQPIELCDWWLPHFYQQHPFTLHTTEAPRRRPMSTIAQFNDAMPPAPRYSFSGRAWELLQIERQLLQKRLVILSGFGGVGKTALAREAASWLSRTKMYTGACFISFEHGGDADLLLSELGTFLGVNDSTYQPFDTEAALARLQFALITRPTLVIVDSLESLKPGGEVPLDSAEWHQLWQVMDTLNASTLNLRNHSCKTSLKPDDRP